MTFLLASSPAPGGSGRRRRSTIGDLHGWGTGETDIDITCGLVDYTLFNPGITVTVPASAATGSVSTDVHGGHHLNVAVLTPDGREIFHDRFKQDLTNLPCPRRRDAASKSATRISSPPPTSSCT
ncbi:hypothetical protein LQL77_30745 [Rhodococcus cerastii]|nr:hypothetical protein [Rhodococcus cerastii]